MPKVRIRSPNGIRIRPVPKNIMDPGSGSTTLCSRIAQKVAADSETFSLVKNGRGLYEREVEVDFNADKYNMEDDPTVR